MAYIGKSPVIGNFVKLDAITAVNGQAAYTMQNGGSNFTDYESVNQFLVSLNGTIQAPTDSFTVSGSTLTFASNLSTGDVIDFIMVFGNSLSAGTPTDATVSTAKIVDSAVTTAKINANAVTSAKLNNDIISGATELASEPADTDEFLVSDAGTLKRIDYSLIKGGGGFTLLSTTSISSAVASVTIGSSSLFSSTYDYYIIRGNMRPVSNGMHGYARVRTSAGQQSGSNYKFNRMWQYSGSATVNTDHSGGAPQLNMVLGQSVNNTHGTTFEIFLSKPNETNNYKSISFRTVNMDSSPDFAHHVSGGAWTGGTEAITGLDLYFSSGNIDTGGVITLHGVNKS